MKVVWLGTIIGVNVPMLLIGYVAFRLEEKMDCDKENQISEILLDVVEPGDSWVVRGIHNEVFVERQELVSPFNSEPELETALMHVTAKLNLAGRHFFWIAMFAVCVVCVGIHMQWFDNLIGSKLKMVRSIWVYLLFLFGAFLVSYQIGEIRSFSIYKSHKAIVINAIRKAGRTPIDVIVELKRKKDLASLYDHMKLDKDFVTF